MIHIWREREDTLKYKTGNTNMVYFIPWKDSEFFPKVEVAKIFYDSIEKV